MTLETHALCVRLGVADALRGVSVRVDDGEMVGIVGPNGSGKSTLVRALAGLIRPVGGTVSLDDRLVDRWSARERAARVGLLSQSGETPEFMTVGEQVGLGRHARRSWLRPWSAEDERATRDAVDWCEVGHLLERRVTALSGGERQRVRLATLLAQEPRMLLLDEPLTGLDIEHQLGLLEVLARLNASGRGVVCVLHDLGLALRWFPRVVVMHAGRVAADGPPREVLCPGLFETVFRVDGRIGRESGGDPVVLCRRCEPGPAEVVVRSGAISSGMRAGRCPLTKPVD